MTRYSASEQARVVVPDSLARPEQCLVATTVIDAVSRDVTGDAWDRAIALFEFVRDEIPYDFTPDLKSIDNWRASATLARGKGFCQQKAVLLAALARAAGIPSAIGFQHIRDHMLIDGRWERWLPNGVIHWHGLTFLWLPTTEGHAWVPADATLDRALCERRGYRLVTLSRETPHAGRLPTTDRRGGPHFDHLAEFGPFDDMPTTIVALLLSLSKVWSEMAAEARATGATM